jgi:hypothetical protein
MMSAEDLVEQMTTNTLPKKGKEDKPAPTHLLTICNMQKAVKMLVDTVTFYTTIPTISVGL